MGLKGVIGTWVFVGFGLLYVLAGHDFGGLGEMGLQGKWVLAFKLGMGWIGEMGFWFSG